jgi:hypothetical protein
MQDQDLHKRYKDIVSNDVWRYGEKCDRLNRLLSQYQKENAKKILHEKVKNIQWDFEAKPRRFRLSSIQHVYVSPIQQYQSLSELFGLVRFDSLKRWKQYGFPSRPLFKQKYQSDFLRSIRTVLLAFERRRLFGIYTVLRRGSGKTESILCGYTILICKPESSVLYRKPAGKKRKTYRKLKQFYISLFQIFDDYQHKGIGKMAVQDILKLFDSLRVENTNQKISYSVALTALDSAKTFWKSCGFHYTSPKNPTNTDMIHRF